MMSKEYKDEFIGVRVPIRLKSQVVVKSNGDISAYVIRLIERDLHGSIFSKIFRSISKEGTQPI